MAANFDNNILKVQQANDIVDLVSEHVNLTRKGKEMVGLCPFHDDHSPSMFVSPAKQIFKCFACGAGGDVFKFVQMRENLTFPQALNRLAERAGIQLPKRKQKYANTQFADVDPNRLAKANAWAAEVFTSNLFHETKGKSARDYLAERNITLETAKLWKIGLALSQNDMVKNAKKQNAELNFLTKAGLVTASLTDRFSNRLMFTITDVTGRIIGFGGRTLTDDTAKYVNTPTTPLFDKSNSIFGLQHARQAIVDSQTAVVVEGYTDCIMAHQLGCNNVVAALGTSFTSGHARLLKRYANSIVLVFDSDTAGLEAANRALEICLAQNIDIKITSVIDAKDPCDFLVTNGPEKFKNLIDNAPDVFQFKYDRLTQAFADSKNLLNRKNAVDEFLRSVAVAITSGAVSPIQQGLIVNRIADIMAVQPRQINAELKKLAKNVSKTVQTIPNTQVTSIPEKLNLAQTAQKEIIEVLLNFPKLAKSFPQDLTQDFFDNQLFKSIALIIFQTLDQPNPDNIELTHILARAAARDIDASVIVNLADAGKQKQNYKKRLSQAIDTIKALKAQSRIVDIKSQNDSDEYLRHLANSKKKHDPRKLGLT